MGDFMKSYFFMDVLTLGGKILQAFIWMQTKQTKRNKFYQFNQIIL